MHSIEYTKDKRNSSVDKEYNTNSHTNFTVTDFIHDMNSTENFKNMTKRQRRQNSKYLTNKNTSSARKPKAHQKMEIRLVHVDLNKRLNEDEPKSKN